MYSCMHIQYHTCITCKNVFFNPEHPLKQLLLTLMFTEIDSVTKKTIFNGHRESCQTQSLPYPKFNLLPYVIHVTQRASICILLESPKYYFFIFRVAYYESNKYYIIQQEFGFGDCFSNLYKKQIYVYKSICNIHIWVYPKTNIFT